MEHAGPRMKPFSGLRFVNKVPSLAVKGAICFLCCEAGSTITRCSKCKRVWYCSNCQEQDRYNHEVNICQQLVAANALNVHRSHEPRTWAEYHHETLVEIPILKAKFGIRDQYERFLTLQPYCSTCYRTVSQIPEDSKLILCDTCHLAHHCSSCQPSNHLARCPDLVEVREAEEFAIQHLRETGQDFSPRFQTETPRTTYVPLSTAKSWYDYYTKISDKSMVAGLLSPDLKPLVGNTDMSAALIAGTDEMCMFLTIIAALEATDLATKPTISLHLVGANVAELGSLTLFEELLHLLPTLKDLHVTFIGPELPISIDGENQTTELDCCQDCTTAKRTRSIRMNTKTYHDYAAAEGYEIPDLAVALQTGHALEQVDSWAPTLRHLTQAAQHPTAFTTFNEHEMTSELACLRALGAKFVVEGERNKWRGMRAILDPLEELESSVYFQNQYWYIVAGQGVNTSS